MTRLPRARVGVGWLLAGLLASAGAGAARADDAPMDHAAHPALPGDAPASDRSLYQLDAPWTDAQGRTVRLGSFRGAPVLLVLFYGTCTSVCPVIVRDLQRVEALLSPADRARTRFVLVTIDPAVDTPERLRAYAEKHGLDPARWALLHGSDDEVRVLANVLGFRYRPTGNGQYSHTIRIYLLDAGGVVADHYDGLTRPVEPIAARVHELLAE